jgi:hypothetical protein
MREGTPVGVMNLWRSQVRPFTDKQVELVTTFADQAVIAIENTRLLNELRQSLEQQTATADVLRVISSSQGDLKPVFEAIVSNAQRICGARFGNLLLFDGKNMRVVAMHNAAPEHVAMRQRDPIIPLEKSILGPLVRRSRCRYRRRRALCQLGACQGRRHENGTCRASTARRRTHRRYRHLQQRSTTVH